MEGLRDEALVMVDELNRRVPRSSITEEQLSAVEEMQNVANGLGKVERIVADPTSFAPATG